MQSKGQPIIDLSDVTARDRPRINKLGEKSRDIVVSWMTQLHIHSGTPGAMF
jgi:hypothetical protein